MTRDMRGDVINRLGWMGYAVTEADEIGLTFAIYKVTNFIKNECNIHEIPDGLHEIAVDMICGEFLLVKKGSGQLADFDETNAVKQISSGDTTVAYALSDKPVTFDSLIDMLINGGRSQFAAYRRFAW
jgi:hypothetical protein